MSENVRVLVLGDVIGQPGCRALFSRLRTILKSNNIDIAVVNGENSANGFGITPEIAKQLFSSGVDVITSGNHIWQKREISPFLDEEKNILRPANYPAGAPGRSYCINTRRGYDIAVLNVQGRIRLGNFNCPFAACREILRKIPQKVKIIIIDFHAESPGEKEALAYYLDGKVSAVLGTHTHVQTADERILKKGTAFITDLGMTGPVDSVIGSHKDIAIQRSLTQMPIKMEIVNNPSLISGVIVDIEADTGKSLKISRYYEELSY